MTDEKLNEDILYLANSLRDSGEYEKAINWYHKLVEQDGHEEEQWYAMYQKGVCRIKSGCDTSGIINDLMNAFNERLWRLESMCALVKFLRENEMYATAYWIGKTLAIRDYPTYDTMFIEKDVYDWKFDDEMSVVSINSGHPEEGRYYAERALENAPETELERIKKNLTLIK